jgi:ribonuclease III
MSDNIRRLEQKIAYTFQNRDFARLAITHRSADKAHNELLEFLGDSILGFTVAELLFHRFPNAPEGDLSRMRSAMVNRQTLAQIARSLGLGELLLLGPGELKSGGRERVSILADAVEAVIGAIYLDSGLDACRATVTDLLLPHMPDPQPGRVHKDSKTRLQEHLQGLGQSVPVYKVLSISGDAHQQRFTVSCIHALLQEATQGTGSNRRIAEQQAALESLRQLGLT